MLIYVCARLRIFSNSGAKIVKNSHIRKYSAENRLEKWILKARTAKEQRKERERTRRRCDTQPTKKQCIDATRSQ